MAAAVQRFVRDFGLLQPGTTPCGKPLSPTQAHALAVISVQPGIAQRDLGAALGLARATTSELVTQLALRNWIEQTASTRDRRQRSIRLTATGRRIAGEVDQARLTLMRSLLSSVAVDERARLVDAVEFLAETIHRYRASEILTDRGDAVAQRPGTAAQQAPVTIADCRVSRRRDSAIQR
jgi:DNA-binding MarR family transcriptional regulator